jgi:hypothetical protein
MHVVGKRKAATGLDHANILLKLVQALRRGRPFCKKGVYRFRTFEEAQKASLDAQTGRSNDEQ